MIYIYRERNWSKLSKDEILCFETKISFKKHVFWLKNVFLSDANSLEQFADGPEVGKFT